LTTTPNARDLVVLVADKNMEACVQGLLSKPKSLQISEIDSAIYVHPGRDAGCHLRAHDFLAGFARQFRKSIIIHDRDGCGRENVERTELESNVESRMEQAGWKDDRCCAVVIDPELEAWVWSDSPHVADVLGWDEGLDDLRKWVISQEVVFNDRGKPSDPKLAVEKVLRRMRTPRSSSIYRELAERVSTRRCRDLAFEKFTSTLRRWFPIR